MVRRTRVENHFNSLRVDQFIECNHDASAALEKVYKRILSMSRQVPKSHRGDSHKNEFPRGAVIGFALDKGPLSRLANANLSFQQLYSELKISVQLKRESVVASVNSNRPTMVTSTDTSISKILFNGQARFVRGREKTHKFNKNRKLNCFNCGSDSHLVKNCSHPVNFGRAASTRIQQLRNKNTRNAIHVLLACLCRELDDCTIKKGEENDKDDVFVFEPVLVQDDTVLATDPTSSIPEQDPNDAKIYTVFQTWESSQSEFWGARIDSGAQQTVKGVKQAPAYLRQTNDNSKIKKENQTPKKHFRFGNKAHVSIGIIEVRMPVADDVVLTFTAQVVPIDVPVLVGLNIMKKLKLLINFDDGTIQSPRNSWRIQMTYKRGHMYVEWPRDFYYTEQEL